ncbi:unnamed protein product, partial [Mesorhabditis belari]|uniref:Uncharacterized protein n=1 Tax=Mesorhabditis belari TaxID=2138241 RepID=A0AAF3FD90_9BILA
MDWAVHLGLLVLLIGLGTRAQPACPNGYRWETGNFDDSAVAQGKFVGYLNYIDSCYESCRIAYGLPQCVNGNVVFDSERRENTSIPNAEIIEQCKDTWKAKVILMAKESVRCLEKHLHK